MDDQNISDIVDQCMVLKTRRAARNVTRRYNSLLKPFGIQSTQASLLAAIRKGGFESISDLAEKMAVERSALTRNLRVLRDAGLITSDNEGRGHAHKVALTKEGLKTLKNVGPLWIKAQKDLREEIGDREWMRAQSALATLGKLA